MPTIDSDAHVVESEHTWDFMDRADQKYRPVVVRPHGAAGQEYWFIDGKIRGLVRIVMTAREMADVSERTGRVMDTPRETREMENVQARLNHMDELGIDVQVLYPTIFIEQMMPDFVQGVRWAPESARLENVRPGVGKLFRLFDA